MNLPELRAKAKKLYDRVYYGDQFPPIGGLHISYARLLELLRDKKVKRLTVMADGRTAIVESPVEGFESNWSNQTFDPRDTT